MVTCVCKICSSRLLEVSVDWVFISIPFFSGYIHHRMYLTCSTFFMCCLVASQADFSETVLLRGERRSGAFFVR